MMDSWPDYEAKYPIRPVPSIRVGRLCYCAASCTGFTINNYWDLTNDCPHMTVNHNGQLEAVAILTNTDSAELLADELDRLDERWCLLGTPVTAMPLTNSDTPHSGLPNGAHVNRRDACDCNHPCAGYYVVHDGGLGLGRLRIAVYHEDRFEGVAVLTGEETTYLIADEINDLVEQYRRRDDEEGGAR